MMIVSLQGRSDAGEWKNGSRTAEDMFRAENVLLATCDNNDAFFAFVLSKANSFIAG